MADKTIKKAKLLNDALVTFKKVSEKVEDLINCSVKDFVILNSNFRKYHNNLKIVSESTNGFINLILDINRNNIHDFIRKTNPDITPIRKNLKDRLDEFRTTQKNANLTLLIINNLKQDLSTVKLLFTNLKFDPLITTDSKQINQLISDTGKCLDNYEKRLKKLSNTLSEAINFTDENFQPGLEVFQDRFKKLMISIEYIFDLESDAKTNKNIISELEVKKNSSTSEIITNLQFQDILRQKIEHVQDAHDQITGNLSTITDGDADIEPEELLQIRDITTLQSAQLIHANQEYQNAVETIVHKFNELNFVFQNYISVWNQFCKVESTKLQAIYTKLNEDFSVLATQILSLKYISENSNSLFLNINTALEEFNIEDNIKTLLCEDLVLLKSTFTNITDSQHLNAGYRPLSQINSEIEKIESGFKKMGVSFNELVKDTKKYNKLPNTEIYKQIEKFNNYIKELTELFELDISDKLNALSNKLHLEPIENFNIDHVAYYKTFEKEVQEIINLLDNLLLGIDMNKKEISKERLEHLRKLYTMDSERKVHDILTGDKMKKSGKDTQANNEDEIEFF